jgi:hypothetical protein
MTLAQIAEKPITVAIVEATMSLADSRHRRRPALFPNKPFQAKSLLTMSLRRPNSIARSSLPVWARYVVAALSGDSDGGIR